MAKSKKNGSNLGRPAQGKERKNVTILGDVMEKGLRLADERRLNFSVMLEQLILEEWERKHPATPNRR